MAAQKRDFSDFSAFPGHVREDGVWTFPVVVGADSKGKLRMWEIYVRLIRTKDGTSPPPRPINWIEDPQYVDEIVGIEEKWYTVVPGQALPQHVIAQMYTVSGQQGGKRSVAAPTYVTAGKNQGKKNARNILQQALIEARSKYLKKIDATGFGASDAPNIVDDINKNKAKRPYPMAAHKYDDNPRDPKSRLVYPLWIQPKFDGGRVVAYWDEDLGKVVAYTRHLKDIDGNDHIMQSLAELFAYIRALPGNIGKGLYLDGEFYKHGLSLQTISGMMRRGARDEGKDARLDYYIFDAFYPFDEGKKNWNFAQRTQLLMTLVKGRVDNSAVRTSAYPYLMFVDELLVDTPKQGDDVYERFINQERWEGAMYRNMEAPYEFSLVKEKRSYHLRKRKPRHSAEYTVIGFTEGDSGKDRGAIIWILRTDGGHEFTSTPVGMTYEERYALFTLFKSDPTVFGREWFGKQMTVEYDDISDDGVPLRAKAKGLRLIP